MIRAIVLLSGGLDSTVILAEAIAKGRICHAITFNYGQKHFVEIEAARRIANHYGITQQFISIDPALFNDSALTNSALQAPVNRSINDIPHSIPSTYVPARNTLFLAYAAAIAEAQKADEIYYGANANDSHPYPDCRPAYMVAFQSVLNLATKRAVVASPPTLMTPLLELSKKEIVEKAKKLSVPVDLTWSCYQPQANLPCQICDACIIRINAFASV